MSCPICHQLSLRQQSIVKYKDYGGVRVIGVEEFCMNRDCNFQEEIYCKR